MSQNVAYDHPHFTIVRQQLMENVQAPASTVVFALFRSRVKALVERVQVICRSNPSVTGGSFHVTRSGATIASKTVAACSVGASLSAAWKLDFELTANNTLHTITEIMGVSHNNNDTGKFDVIYEYRLLPT